MATADVIRGVHECDQLCQDLQTEFVLIRERPGAGRINHIFRAHDHTILTEETAAKTFGQVGQVSLEWRSKLRSVQGSQELGVRDR